MGKASGAGEPGEARAGERGRYVRRPPTACAAPQCVTLCQGAGRSLSRGRDRHEPEALVLTWMYEYSCSDRAGSQSLTELFGSSACMGRRKPHNGLGACAAKLPACVCQCCTVSQAAAMQDVSLAFPLDWPAQRPQFGRVRASRNSELSAPCNSR